jgi:hypothetical protein
VGQWSSFLGLRTGVRAWEKLRTVLPLTCRYPRRCGALHERRRAGVCVQVNTSSAVTDAHRLQEELHSLKNKSERKGWRFSVHSQSARSAPSSAGGSHSGSETRHVVSGSTNPSLLQSWDMSWDGSHRGATPSGTPGVSRRGSLRPTKEEDAPQGAPSGPPGGPVTVVSRAPEPEL